jgi:hypothetical protein
MSTPVSLSSLDSTPPRHTFEKIYSLLNQLNTDTTKLQNTMKQYSKRITQRDLPDMILEPKPHAVSWFRGRKMRGSCTLEVFIDTLVADVASRHDMNLNTRSLTLIEEEAALFELPAGTYRWIEILQRLPHVFK